MNKNVTIPEDSSAQFSVALTDPDRLPVVPTQAFLSIFCLTTKTVVREEAALTAIASTLPVLIAATENAIIERSNPTETKRAVLRVKYGVGEQLVSSYDYTVRKVRP